MATVVSTTTEWDKDHVVDLLHVDGQRLHLDMAQADCVDFNIERDHHEHADGNRVLDEMVTLTYVVRVPNPGPQWVDA